LRTLCLIKTKIVSLILGGILVASAPAAADGRLPGAKVFKACAGAGPYWPTMTLALDGRSAWVACKEQARVIRLNTRTGKITASIRLGAPVIAVATGYGSIWALDTGSTLSRIKPSTARVTRRVTLAAAAPYNVWTGGGSIWVAEDQGARVIRVSPATGKILKRLPVGDGPADMAFADNAAWVINHRDRRLMRINLATNSVTELATLPGDAPERMTWLGGSLWITGRGTDLLQVDPQTGAVKSTIEIGAGGIDVVAAAGSLWVPVRSATVDSTGFPTMETLRRVSASTRQVTTAATASGRLDVHGLQAGGGFVWIADNRSGVVFRVRA
jgi:streptogramin lyase